MTAHTSPVTLTPLRGFPEVREGDVLADLVLSALQHNMIQLIDGDILVVSSKVVSKAMGLRVAGGRPADVVRSQTVRVVAERMTPSGVTRIVESAAGPVMTAAGVDASNTAQESTVLVLPADPDAVAAQIRDGVESGWLSRSGTPLLTGVIVSDTAGRPWRNGQTDFALGAAGIQVMDDLRGSADTGGRLLSVTERCIADEIAAAADLVKGKTTGVPVAHIRGLGQYVHQPGFEELGLHDQGARIQGVQSRELAYGARVLIRTGPQDWFGYGMVEAVRAALGVVPGSAVASEVGIASIHPEPVVTRAWRALRVALLTCPGAVGAVDGHKITLTAPDDFSLGMATARAEVALRGEGLTPSLSRSPAFGDDGVTEHPGVLLHLNDTDSAQSG